MHKILQPEAWAKPRGYSNGVIAEGRQIIFVGGQIGWNTQCQFESSDFVAQVRQTLENIVAVLSSADAGAEHITRMTWYVTDKQTYNRNLTAIGGVYREVMGRHFPPMSVVQVVALMEDEARVEIEVTAVK